MPSSRELGHGPGSSSASPSLTPSTYDATNRWVSSEQAANARCAVSTVRIRRENRSHETPGLAGDLRRRAVRAAAQPLELPGAVARR